MHTSISTIDAPEFINLQPLEINPLMSACEIKVLYLGENRNHSYISKDVATTMAKTLRGAPIVGYYKKDKEDFADHGQKVIMDDEGIHFECMTVPYGFVDPAAEVWFQKFTDYDDFGNEIEREYLMTTGYLWTGQFEECKVAVEEGRPHSMELDEKTLKGNWSTNINSGIEFFIINDAIFSKLCILGDDVEPCFEGSSVKAPEVSATFSLDDKFTRTLYSMMEELKFALKGGNDMENIQIAVETKEEEKVVTTEFEDASESTESSDSTDTTEETTEETVEPVALASEESDEENEEQEEEVFTDDIASKKQFEKSEEEVVEPETDYVAEYTALKTSYSELETKFTALQAEYETLQNTCNSLAAFKNSIEDKEKDEMISKFYKLSEADLKEIKENKSKYTVEEIESKLAVLYFRKGFGFEDETAETEVEHEEVAITTYNLDEQADLTPDWIKAVELAQKNRNI